jgi:glycosyltransferase involved in cell wall biosynthesis
MTNNKTSAFIITYNEEKNIKDCLESLKWTDEIVVVDSYSTDRTCDIAREYTDRVIKHEFQGHVGQTRYASEQTSHPWIMWLDADERLTPEAIEEIHRQFDSGVTEEYKAFSFPRRTFFIDRWILHSGWYPQPKIRFWHRDHAHISGDEPHPHVELKENAKEKVLEGDILHYSYPNGLRDMVATSTKYARLGAERRYNEGRRYHLWSALLKPPATFLKKYCLQLGFLDGTPGLAIAVGSGYYRFMKEFMLWELEQEGEDCAHK